MSCALCEAAPITHRFSDTPVCWVALCSSCEVPMAVLKRHTVKPTIAEVSEMIAELSIAAKAFFGDYPWDIDDAMLSIPDHAHIHARPMLV